MNSEKESIIIKLKESGCRITKQREMILDVILESRCSSCKEIYIKVAKVNQSIGMATIYRMVKELEKIDVLSREIYYK
ncbi:transcriptional repressor [Faecalimonas sp.]